MIKIQYPNEMKDILDSYIKVLDIDKKTRDRFKIFQKLMHQKHNLRLPSIDDILCGNFQQICNILDKMPSFQVRHIRRLKSIFHYDKYQSKISNFFMANKHVLTLRTCYYCNIDYINIFKGMADYQSGLDFVKRASEQELSQIKNIGNEKIKKILSERSQIKSLDQLSLSKQTIEYLEQIVIKKEYNHFTLDHIIDKGTHPLFALSFFNFVPSCYTCNSKLKKSVKLINKNNIKECLSPTSTNFNFDQNVKFKIKFYKDGKELEKENFIKITSEKDFILTIDCSENYKDYVKTFQLEGRYIFHKREVVDLIENSIRYPESRQREISRLIGTSTIEIKKNLFGKEVYEGSLEDVPLTKFKRDICREIGIL